MTDDELATEACHDYMNRALQAESHARHYDLPLYETFDRQKSEAIRRMRDELRKRRAADLTDEEYKSLEDARWIVDHAVSGIGEGRLKHHARIVLDKLLARGGR